MRRVWFSALLSSFWFRRVAVAIQSKSCRYSVCRPHAKHSIVVNADCIRLHFEDSKSFSSLCLKLIISGCCRSVPHILAAGSQRFVFKHLLSVYKFWLKYTFLSRWYLYCAPLIRICVLTSHYKRRFSTENWDVAIVRQFQLIFLVIKSLLHPIILLFDLLSS